MTHDYDLVISFAGADRSVARDIAGRLQAAGICVFYDEFNRASLWGKNLYEELADIYSNRARFCLMLISASYAQKMWTAHERRHAQERALRNTAEYILPVRLDDTKLPGLPDTIAYLDLREASIAELVELIETKLGRMSRPPVMLGRSQSLHDLPIDLGSQRQTVRAILGEPENTGASFDTFQTYGLAVNYVSDVVSCIRATTLYSGTFFGRVLGVRIGDDLDQCKTLWGEPTSVDHWPVDYDVYTWRVEGYTMRLEIWTTNGLEPLFGPHRPGRVKDISIERSAARSNEA